MIKNITIFKKNCKKINFFAFILIFLTFLSTFLTFFTNQVFGENNYYFTTQVEHLFTHCLIAYPDIAFKNNNEMKKHYSADCITSTEFVSILNELYKNNYVLVKISSCFNIDKNGVATKQKIKLPIGKKALILSFDDVNYDQKKMGLGMVDKIIVDNNGDLASLTQINNKNDIRNDLEFAPILEQFVKKHPDFSVNGAKGVLNLTGYDGILGYRTGHKNKTNRKQEIKQAKVVVNKLKSLGWEFACHSYGHYHMNKISLEKFNEEVLMWKNEVEPLIGQTSVYVYPYGEWQVFDNGDICQKHKILQNAGFSLFCGVGMQTFYSYLSNKKGHKVLFMDRKCVDGNTILANRIELVPFFNPANIVDFARFK